MTFPSNYKVAQQAGGTEGVIAVTIGAARQLIINTTDWSIHIMDGTTAGGHKVVMVGHLHDLLQDSNILLQGTKTMVEIGDDGLEGDEQVAVWKASVLLAIFQKLADTTVAGTWRLKDGAHQDRLKAAALNVNDLNDAIYNGFYTADPSTAGNLPADIDTGTNRNVSIIVNAQSIDNLIQVLYDRDGSGKIYTRAKVDTVWEDWILSTGVTTADLNQKFDKAGGTITGDVDMDGNSITDAFDLNGASLGRWNYIINGDSRVRQRADSQTTSGYGSDDRWRNAHFGSTKTHSIIATPLNDLAALKNTPFYSRTVVVSVAGAANTVYRQQRIEDVRILAGKKVTVTFYAKADSVKDIAMNLAQSFGTGGSPSAAVTLIGAQRFTLSTEWQKFTAVIDVPGIADKTLGTNNDHYLGLTFWFDAGSNLNADTLNLGQQSGTFDMTRVSLVIGDASKEDDPFGMRSTDQEESLCFRFFEKMKTISIITSPRAAPTGWQTTAVAMWFFKTRKRSIPTITASATGGSLNESAAELDGVRFALSPTDPATAIVPGATADSEL